MELKFEERFDEDKTTTEQGDRYFLVQDENGHLTCSCGRALIKLDEYTYRCSGGYPTYRPEDDTVIKDKDGNIQLKELPHEE